MKISVLKEPKTELRIAVIPEVVKKLTDLGCVITLEKGVGHTLHSDSEFKDAGAKIAAKKADLFDTDLLLQVRCPSTKDLKNCKPNTQLLCFMDPFNSEKALAICNQAELTTYSIELIPRTTIAQKMDALSSQASLAGYVAITLAAERLNKVLPMMMTPAGTIAPAKVFIIGAGVAGLQAIATAKRLGARVEAFDTRPVVAEQVQSLGAKFLQIDLGETGQTKDGYAKALTADQLEKQRALMASACAGADIVVTTAQLFGRQAPLIITQSIIDQMQPGSIIVDLAVESGGNVAGSELNQEKNVNGVTIIGLANLPGYVAKHASQVYATNLFHFVAEFFDVKKKKIVINKKNDIMKSVLTTTKGKIVQPLLKERFKNTK
ncbi:NAD(P)(+) transhydrogenase (Re/Si-specific) subunit alpha [Candidatus Marinamargulisbacteria bacterium SCGC AG-414-C22]|nr:NAD(P)(+) transhydrogenase (Re/Si-specific) subunit alpha [Candidatus Marinamargulisbacteria bacterium SCGC AG-414-C22]